MKLSRKTTLALLLNAATCKYSPSANAELTNTLQQNMIQLVQAAKNTQMQTSAALRPSYKIESKDIEYPKTFLGKWQATSTLVNVLAPAGDELFAPGRNGTLALQTARADIGQPLKYECRWRRQGGDGPVIVDREFNVASISRAAMGSQAVQNVQADGADKVTLILKPSKAQKGLLYIADLRVVGRRTDAPLPGRSDLFACAEITRQSLKLAPGEGTALGATNRAPVVKEVETICTYEMDSSGDMMHGYQRTSTFLCADSTYTSDPTLAEMTAQQLARTPSGRPIAVDVRLYELDYKRMT